MSKDTYQIKVKAESRKRWMRFIRGSIKNRRHRVRVLCFPGPEALEIFEVYDKLSIPRQNITCLERDKESYEKIMALNLGCNVVHADLFNFIHTNKNSKFDIISLDFTGQIGSCGPELFHLVREGLLADNCFIFTNFSAAREQDYTKAYYLLGATQYKSIIDQQPDDNAHREEAKRRLKTLSKSKGLPLKFVNNHEEALEELFKPNFDQIKSDRFPVPNGVFKNKSDGKFDFENITEDIHEKKLVEAPVRDLRDVAIWHMVREALINGRTNPLHDIAYKQFKFVIDEVKKNSINEYPEHYSHQMVEALKSIQRVTERIGDDLVAAVKQILDYIIVATLKDIFSVQFTLDEDNGQFLARGKTQVRVKGKNEIGDFYFTMPMFMATNFLLFQLYELLTDARVVKRTESYKYASGNGMPMFCDMFEMRKPNFSLLEPLINIKAETVEEFFDPITKLPPLEIGNILKAMEEASWRLEGDKITSAPNRIDLGRESNINPKVIPIPPPAPPVPEPLEIETEDYIELKKEEALAYKNIMPELTSKEIGKAINVNPRKVAAWLAHLTMGTYKTKKDEVG